MVLPCGCSLPECFMPANQLFHLVCPAPCLTSVWSDWLFDCEPGLLCQSRLGRLQPLLGWRAQIKLMDNSEEGWNQQTHDMTSQQSDHWPCWSFSQCCSHRSFRSFCFAMTYSSFSLTWIRGYRYYDNLWKQMPNYPCSMQGHTVGVCNAKVCHRRKALKQCLFF